MLHNYELPKKQLFKLDEYFIQCQKSTKNVF